MFIFQNNKKKGITLQLLLYILAFSTFITLITTAVNLYVDYSIDIKQIQKRIQNIQKSNLASLSQSLWYMDAKYAETQLNGILQLPDIQYLKITSKIQQNNLSTGILQTQNILSYEFPLVHKANEQEYDVGIIRIVVTLNNVYQRLFNKILVILGTQAFKTFLVSGFIFIIVQWLITRHLVKISNYIQKLKINNLDQLLQLPQSVNKENELSQVVMAINSMKSDLHKKIDALRKSEARYIDLYDNAPDMFVSVNAKSADIINCNQTLCNMTGYTKEEIVGHPIFFMYHPDCMNDVKKIFQTFVETGEVNNKELKLKRKDGSKIDVMLNVSAVRDKQGQILYSRSNWRDITKLKKAEKMSKTSDEQYRAVVDNIGDYIMRYDRECRHIYANKNAIEITGLIKEQYIGKTHREMGFPEPMCELWEKNIQHVFETGKQLKIEFDVEMPEGLMTFDLQLNPEITKKGSVETVIGISRDVTERKIAEKDNQQLQKKLHQAQKMESIGTLTGGIAHDFNNILGIIVGNTELALDDVPKWNSAHSNIEEIKTASLRAKNIVKQLLSFSRKTDQKLQPIQIASVIKEALKFLRSTIPTTINIHRDIQTTDETILADPTQINQILMNLCINASHAMEQTGGDLNVTVAKVVLDDNSAKVYPDLKSGDHVKIIVSDTGPGIDSEIIDQIFDPYFTTKEVGKGSGMGLAVVHGIVKNHKGAINVDSSLGKGTKFSILFPLTTEEQVVEAQTTKDIPGGNETILFVDDEISIIKMVQRMFERLGYKVETATTPQEALDRFSLNPDHFDLVITDMTMPQMTGVKLSEKLMDIREDIPIIICTGHSTLVDEEKAKSLGLAAYVMKPIDMQETAQTIRKVLDKK
jgi:PAS domain S-box-containing protein